MSIVETVSKAATMSDIEKANSCHAQNGQFCGGTQGGTPSIAATPTKKAKKERAMQAQTEFNEERLKAQKTFDESRSQLVSEHLKIKNPSAQENAAYSTKNKKIRDTYNESISSAVKRIQEKHGVTRRPGDGLMFE